MSNIKDLQRLRGTKNRPIFAQTNYPISLNPQSRLSYYENFQDRAPALTSRSPKKIYKETEDTRQSPSKISPHKRRVSFGVGLKLGQGKNSLIFENPRFSIYNVSIKAVENKNKDIIQFDDHLADLKQRDNFFQINQTFSRKKGSFVSSISPSKTQEISKKMFSMLYPIGKGGFGKVWKAQFKKTRQPYAMKLMSKAKIIHKKSVSSVMNEKQFLSKISHPFLVNMSWAFQDRQSLYLILDYLDGGDLRYHIGNKRTFNQKQTKFFIANLLIGLQFLHKNKIIHRDIKPENLVLDSNGYLRITDLGVSRQFRQNNSSDTSGTPGYMAPQVMCRKDHSYTADYFAIGVIAYEFMLGRRPYLGKDRKEIKQNMLGKQVQVRFDELPLKWSPHAIDFINKLIIRNPLNRLGSNGIDEIKNHPWLLDIQWERMSQKRLKAPFRPISIEEDYQSYKQQISQDTVDQNQEETMLMLRDEQTQNLFEGYHFQRKEQKEKKNNSSYSTSYTEDSKKK